MAVFVEPTQQEIEQFLEHYNLGKLISYQSIAHGTENSNFFINLDPSSIRNNAIVNEYLPIDYRDKKVYSFVLTIFEQYPQQEMDFFMSLLNHLYKKGVATALPIAPKHYKTNNSFVLSLKNKPAILMQRLTGAAILNGLASISQCSLIGAELAKIHKATMDFKLFRQNALNIAWSDKIFTKIRKLEDDFWQEGDKQFFQELLQEQKSLDINEFKQGVIHADLFQDNCLFLEKGGISGVIDFYFACNDAWLFDLAVVLNSWAMTLEFGYDTERFDIIVATYLREINCNKIQISEQELIKHLPVFLRRAGLRFWTSRVHDKLFYKHRNIGEPHDPTVMRDILRYASAYKF